MDAPREGVAVELTRRERQVLSLLLEGKSNEQIAVSLSISVRTVRFHLYNIFLKLNVDNRLQAVLKAVQLGLGSAAAAAEGAPLPPQRPMRVAPKRKIKTPRVPGRPR